MEKRKLLMRVIPFSVSFLLVLGFLYWQRTESDKPSLRSEVTSLLEYDTQGKSSREVAQWIYDSYGCQTCHSLTQSGVFGLTAYGEVMARDFQGCPGMLTTVVETLSVPEAQWTDVQKTTRLDFERFGCTVCHQIGSTSLGLTEIGAHAALLHMSCSEISATVSH